MLLFFLVISDQVFSLKELREPISSYRTFHCWLDEVVFCLSLFLPECDVTLLFVSTFSWFYSEAVILSRLTVCYILPKRLCHFWLMLGPGMWHQWLIQDFHFVYFSRKFWQDLSTRVCNQEKPTQSLWQLLNDTIGTLFVNWDVSFFYWR